MAYNRLPEHPRLSSPTLRVYNLGSRIQRLGFRVQGLKGLGSSQRNVKINCGGSLTELHTTFSEDLELRSASLRKLYGVYGLDFRVKSLVIRV